MSKKSGRILPILLALLIIFSSTSQVFAARVGDTKTISNSFTVKEMTSLVAQFDEAIAMKTGQGLVNKASMYFGAVGGEIMRDFYKGTWFVIKYQIVQDRNYYENIRATMVKNKYSRVVINTKSKYTEYKMSGEYYYAWALQSRSVSQYYR